MFVEERMWHRISISLTNNIWSISPWIFQWFFMLLHSIATFWNHSSCLIFLYNNMIYGPTLINYNLFDDVKELDNNIQRSCDPEIWSTTLSYIATTRFELDSLRCGLDSAIRRDRKIKNLLWLCLLCSLISVAAVNCEQWKCFLMKEDYSMVEDLRTAAFSLSSTHLLSFLFSRSMH